MLEVTGTNDAIVLLNPDACRVGPFRNLLRLSADGSVDWRAELPDTRDNNDAYVAVRWAGARFLLANTWTCHAVNIDAESGRLFGTASFTK